MQGKVEEEVSEAAVKTRHTRQQTLVSLLPQSKTGHLAAAGKLNPKKRNRNGDTVKSVGLTATLRHTRSKSAVVA